MTLPVFLFLVFLFHAQNFSLCCCRATTCYLAPRHVGMLPKPLTENICSLRSNVKRLAFSAIWEMTQDAQVLSFRYSLDIRVCINIDVSSGVTSSR